MLSPEFALSRPLLGVALLALVVLLVIRAVRKDRTEYDEFKGYTTTAPRQRMMRKWVLSSLAMFGTASVVVLLLAWQYIAPLLAAVRAWPASRWFAGEVEASNGLIEGIAVGVAIALVAGTVLAVYLARASTEVPTIGDIGSLLPRNRAELRFGALLSINAGVVEELMFRLALPALVFAVTGNAVVAVLGSVVLFGLLHIYQGAVGVIGSLVLGAILMVIYLATGSIVIAMVAHALIDLRSLVLIPIMVYGVHRVHGDAVNESSEGPHDDPLEVDSPHPQD